MAGLPQGLPKPRAQPQRAPPPSTISNTSSTSSNATVVPHVTTPRARSLPLPDPHSISNDWPVQMEKGSGGPSTRTNGTNRRHPHWDAPALMAQDIALLDENTVLEGLTWRLAQFLVIQPPYGLVTPEIAAACRLDPNICGPAIDMLISATLADGDPPVSELPFVRADASGKQHANYTVPLTASNCPEGLKKLFATWTGVAQQLRQLDPQFHTEIARNICDLEPLMNVLSPQVARIAADLKKMAEEISLRRLFLSRFTEVLLERLRESEGATLAIFPSSGGSAARLPPLGEANESDSSSNSSRSSSRSSRRSRSGSNSRGQHDRSRKWGGAPGTGDAHSEPSHHSNGLRSRSSSTSLRLGPDGVPLEDGTDLTDLSGTRLQSSARGNNGAASPRPPHHTPQHPPSPSQRPDIYGGILTIPAFSGDESTSNFSSNQSSILPPPPPPQQQLLNQTNTSPKPPSNPEMLASLRMNTSPPMANSPQYGARPPNVSPPPRSYSPAGSALSAEGPPSGSSTLLSMRSRGPRPLPPRPSRSPKPEELYAQPQSAPAPAPALPLPAAPPAQLNFAFTVPDQGDSLSYVNEIKPFQIPSQDPGVFVVPSEIPSETEVSSSSHGLEAARQRFAMESTSSLHRLESDYRDMKISDASNYGPPVRHGQANVTMPPRLSNGAPTISSVSHSGNSKRHLMDLRNAGSSDPLIPSWASPETYQAIANSSAQFIPGINGPGSNWTPPSSWDEPPPSVSSSSAVNSTPKESGGLFSGMKQWLRHNDGSSSKGTSRGSESSHAPSSSGGVTASSSQGRSRGHIEVDTRPLASYESVNQINAGNGIFGSTRQQHNGGTNNPVHTISPAPMNGKPVSPGFAEIYQINPIAASRFYGGNTSGTQQPAPAPPSSFPLDKKTMPRPAATADLNVTPEVEAIRQTMYSAITDSLATPGLRQVMQKDAPRAFFSAVSLANLNVSMNLQSGTNDSPNLVSMMGREIRLTNLPGAYRTCITELAAIGREARKLSEEDDERAIAYVARGKALPEPRIGRVRKLLERGVGFVGSDGRVRGAKEPSGTGTGRSREFSNKISALSIEMMKLPAFQEEMLQRLVA